MIICILTDVHFPCFELIFICLFFVFYKFHCISFICNIQNKWVGFCHVFGYSFVTEMILTIFFWDYHLLNKNQKHYNTKKSGVYNADIYSYNNDHIIYKQRHLYCFAIKVVQIKKKIQLFSWFLSLYILLLCSPLKIMLYYFHIIYKAKLDFFFFIVDKEKSNAIRRWFWNNKTNKQWSICVSKHYFLCYFVLFVYLFNKWIFLSMSLNVN